MKYCALLLHDHQWYRMDDRRSQDDDVNVIKKKSLNLPGTVSRMVSAATIVKLLKHKHCVKWGMGCRSTAYGDCNDLRPVGQVKHVTGSSSRVVGLGLVLYGLLIHTNVSSQIGDTHSQEITTKTYLQSVKIFYSNILTDQK